MPQATVDTVGGANPNVVQPAKRVFAPLGAIALGMAVMFTFLWAFSVFTAPLESLMGACVACAAGLIVISQVYYVRRLGRFFTVLVLLVFLIKIVIGVGHYLYFFEPNYFNQPLGFFPWSYDFGILPEGMQNISAFWHMYGFVDVPRVPLADKAWILAVYHALLYYLSGDRFLNFVPWAAFHTLLVGFLVTSLALQRGATRRQATAAFVLAGLQPFFLYSDLPQRDMVGQFFVVLAVYLVVHTLNRTSHLMLILPFALILVYALRSTYPYVILIYIFLVYLMAKRRTRVALALLCILVVAWLAVGTLATDLTLGNYSKLPTTSISHLPAAILAGIIGPFPWTQVFEIQDAFIHLPPSFLQAWLGVVIWLIVWPRLRRQWRAFRTVDELALISFLFAFSGVLTAATHTSYIHVATVLLLPMACQAPTREWVRNAVVVFYLYLVGHIVFYGLGLNGRGLFIR
jgi:hypothetical protein